MPTSATATAALAACALALVVLVGVVLTAARPGASGPGASGPGAEAFAEYLNKRSSCFDCERDFAPSERWRAQPSKCFSCERQLAATPGGDPFTASRTVWR